MFIAGVNKSGDKLFTGVNDTVNKFTNEYLREFLYKFEMAPIGSSQAGGKLIHKINLILKSCVRLPLS
jgi:hypothetical protein